MECRIMIAVEYFDEYILKGNDNNHSTFEIFETIKEAYDFASTVKYKESFIADFNMKYVYKEDKNWNYEDNSALYGYSKIITFPDLIKFK